MSAKPIDPAWARELVDQPRWYTKVELDEATGCWMWIGQTNSKHYPRLVIGGKSWPAHRISLVAHLGRDLKPGMQADHLCRTRGCVNPLHLREASNWTNNWAKNGQDVPQKPEWMVYGSPR